MKQSKAQNPKRQTAAQKAKLLVLRLSLALCALSFTCSFCAAQSLGSRELINNARRYDGKIIAYEGEAVGELMKRGNFAWVNIHDGANAIGVWVEEGLSREIVNTGGYQSRGDWIEVVGVFHNACVEHGGDLDIHATAIRRLAAGKKLPGHINLEKRNLVIVLAGVLCLVLILKLFKKMRKKK